jgi:hypothetical protein
MHLLSATDSPSTQFVNNDILSDCLLGEVRGPAILHEPSIFCCPVCMQSLSTETQHTHFLVCEFAILGMLLHMHQLHTYAHVRASTMNRILHVSPYNRKAKPFKTCPECVAPHFLRKQTKPVGHSAKENSSFTPFRWSAFAVALCCVSFLLWDTTEGCSFVVLCVCVFV